MPRTAVAAWRLLVCTRMNTAWRAWLRGGIAAIGGAGAITAACDAEPPCEAVASCHVGGFAPSRGGEVAGYCRQYVGSLWTADLVRSTCPASAAEYVDGCCDTSAAIARCLVAPGTFNEWHDYYFPDTGWTLGEARSICESTNAGGNVFEELGRGTGSTEAAPASSVASTTSSTSGSGGAGGSSTGTGDATCASVCAEITADCATVLTDCLEECSKDELNAGSCDETEAWQALLDCCAGADFTPFCDETRFDPCQSGVCGALRPDGAAAGCE